MYRKNLGIGILCITAVALLLACFMDTKPALGEFSTAKGDYQVATVKMQTGDDALYVFDNRLGKVAIFVYDFNRRLIIPAAIQDMTDAFANNGGAAPAGIGRGTR